MKQEKIECHRVVFDAAQYEPSHLRMDHCLPRCVLPKSTDRYSLKFVFERRSLKLDECATRKGRKTGFCSWPEGEILLRRVHDSGTSTVLLCYSCLSCLPCIRLLDVALQPRMRNNLQYLSNLLRMSHWTITNHKGRSFVGVTPGCARQTSRAGATKISTIFRGWEDAQSEVEISLGTTLELS